MLAPEEQQRARWFAQIKSAPPDPVFGLMELYRQDPRSGKVNLTVGAFQDELGHTPVLECVYQAEQRLLEKRASKNYLPIDGGAAFNQLIPELIFGTDHAVLHEPRYCCLQTPGGTGALRIAGDLLRRVLGVRTISLGKPTWANHPQIFNASGLEVLEYRYLNDAATAIDFAAILAHLKEVDPGQAVLVHTVCHNPTGFDFTRDQWSELFQVFDERNLIPVFDFAYQGFGENLDEDPWPIREYCQDGRPAMICSSFSKNLGLYGERAGGLTLVANHSKSIGPLLSQAKAIVRTLYSTPPQHAGAIVEVVLQDPNLRSQWIAEVDAMRARIDGVRSDFVRAMRQAAPHRDFSFILEQQGMFSYCGLNREQAIRLREDHGIYIVESGRVNIAGINQKNIDRVTQSIASVL